MTLLIHLLLFLAVALATLALLRLGLARPTLRPLPRPTAQPAGGRWPQSMLRLLAPLARLSTPSAPDRVSATRRMLQQAGWISPYAPRAYFAAKTLLPLLVGTLGFVLAPLGTIAADRHLLWLTLVGATVACYLPNLALWRRRTQRQLDLLEAFPDAADLLRVCVESGLGLDAALVRVAEEIRPRSPALAQEIHRANLEIRAGIGRGQALRNLGERTGLDEAAGLAAMLSQTERFGTSVGESLRVYSDDLRRRRQIRAEEATAKVATKMLFPLVFCIFPAVFLVILGPALIRIFRSLMPLLGGDAGAP